ncbi:MAG TPA: translocation/assembly module TamB domain-containing protein, partial [Steroidobacteraceae bacterium]|nr:translocation/assembly module TamB domain-containing protein [Steroidobacteraceae bacterium]
RADTPLNVDATLRLDSPQRPLQLSASHRLLMLQTHAMTAGEPRANFSLRLPELAPLAAIAGLRVRGSSTLTGTLQQNSGATRLEVDADSELANDLALPVALLSGRSRLQLAVTLTDRALELERLTLNTRMLAASASGSAKRTTSAGTSALEALRGRYQISLAELGVLTHSLGGTAKLTGELEGAPNSFVTQAALDAAISVRGAPRESVEARITARGLPALTSATVSANGTLVGAPLQLDASLQRAGENAYRLIVRRADWKSAHADGDLTADARLTAGHGSLRLRMDRLADLQPLLGTSVQGSVAGSLTVKPAARGSYADARLEGRNVVLGGIAADARLHAAGTVDALSVQLSAQAPDLGGVPARVDTTARLNLAARDLALEQATAHYRGQTVRLLAPARLIFADGLVIRQLQLGVQRARIEVDGRIAPGLELRASVHHVDAALVSAFLPDTLAHGTFDADAQLSGAASAPGGVVKLQAADVRFANPAVRDLQALGLQATAHLQGDAAQLEVHLSGARNAQLTLTGALPLRAAGALNLRLDGKIDAALANPVLEARGERAAGTVTVRAAVTGPVRAPQTDGTIDLAHGDLRDYTQGIHVSDITAHLIGTQGALKIASLTARAAPGQISMEGTVGVLQPQLPLDVHLTATNAQPISSDLLTANLSADLRAKGTLRERLDVSGTLNLNRTLVGIPNALPPDVAVLDVRRPGAAPPPPADHKLVIGLDVQVHAPREVRVQGRGLNAELGGDVRLRGTADSPQVSGGFDLIRGTFALASTQLDFTTGRVSFNGAGLHNKINPTLDFTAQTATVDATVTLHVTGFADAPQFTLDSSPQMPQDEILARLLFGVSASQLSALQLAQIGAALASLSGVGGGGPNPLARLQKSLGLDRLSVGSGAPPPGAAGQNSGTSVEAGRYVSERVFIGLKRSTTGFSQAEADVDLSKHLKLRTQLGNGTATTQGTTPENDPGSSVGLVYQFEY